MLLLLCSSLSPSKPQQQIQTCKHASHLLDIVLYSCKRSSQRVRQHKHLWGVQPLGLECSKDFDKYSVRKISPSQLAASPCVGAKDTGRHMEFPSRSVCFFGTRRQAKNTRLGCDATAAFWIVSDHVAVSSKRNATKQRTSSYFSLFLGHLSGCCFDLPLAY